MACWKILLAACILLLVTSEALPPDSALFSNLFKTRSANEGDIINIPCDTLYDYGFFYITTSLYRNGKKTSYSSFTAGKADNQARYECRRDSDGRVEKVVTMTVYFKPSTIVMLQKPPAAVQEGTMFIITCETDSANPAANIQFYRRSRNREKLTAMTSNDRVGDYHGTIRTTTLMMPANRSDNQAVFECQADNLKQSTSFTVYWPATELNMVDEPHGPVDAGVNETIRCETDSSNTGPPGPILWYRNRRRVTAGVKASYRMVSDGGTISVSELTFTVRKEDNQANYECKINDQASFRQDVNMAVHFKPSKIVMIHKPAAAINEGKVFMITCATDSANPPASILFYRRRGTHRERLTKGIATDERMAEYNGRIRTSTLAVTAGRTDNQAVFKCQVQDGSFHLQQATTVTVNSTDLLLSGEESAQTADTIRVPLGAIGGAAVAVATMLILVVIVVVMLRRRSQACFSARDQPEAATPGDGVGHNDLARPADDVVNDPIYVNNTNRGFEGDDIPVEPVYVNDPRRQIEHDMPDEDDYEENRNTYYADLNITPEVIAAQTYADLRQGTSTQPRRY